MPLSEDENDEAASCSSGMAEDTMPQAQSSGTASPSRKNAKAKKLKSKKNSPSKAKSREDDFEEALMESEKSMKGSTVDTGSAPGDAIVLASAITVNIEQPRCCLICGKSMHANNLAR